MTSPSFDFVPHLRSGLPAPAARWSGFPKFNFTGGHNDAAQVPVDKLVAAAAAVLTREGPTLATYGLESGPLGYRPLREFLVGKLKRDAGISCTASTVKQSCPNSRLTKPTNRRLRSRPTAVPASMTQARSAGSK